MKPIALLFLSLCCCPFGFAQKPDEDVLLLVDGEKLIGHLDHSAGSSLVFKSDLAGQITLDWSKVQELHTNSKFAVIPKGVKVHGKTGQTDEAKIPQGNLSVSNNAIAVAGTQQMVPVSDTGYLVDEDTFEKHVLTKPSFVEDWSGAVTAGATLVLATENSRSYTSAIHLARVVPNEAWFDLQSRLTVDFTSSFGEITQPGQPLVKTNILHGNIERDHYFSSRVYDYVSGGWDHNYSEGLDLQQIYGGGVGVTAIKNDNEQLDLRAGMDFIQQQFQAASNNKSLIGSTFSEAYNQKLPRNVMLTESLTITPTWNIVNALSATGSLAVTMPLFKRLHLTLGALDNFLNDPSPGFKKNSFQFTTGITYVIP